MIEISSSSITLVTTGIIVLGAIFTAFFYFQKPQLAQDKRITKLEERATDQDKEISAIKKTHYETNGVMEKELKEMTTAVNELSITVTRLSTIIDERIPKNPQGLK